MSFRYVIGMAVLLGAGMAQAADTAGPATPRKACGCRV